MSLIYEETNNEYSKSSRYQVLRVLLDSKSRYLETYNQVSIPEATNDIYHVVAHNEENRLDIIANTYYGDPTFWWAIALANNMIDPYTVQEGTMIRIPHMSSLYDYDNEILERRSE